MLVRYFDVAIPFAVKDIVDSMSVRELTESPTLPHFSTVPNVQAPVLSDENPKVPVVSARILRCATRKHKTRRLR
jgi:hypothetical protein